MRLLNITSNSFPGIFNNGEVFKNCIVCLSFEPSSYIIRLEHRSISLFNNKTYSSTFTWLFDFNKKETLVYADILKKNKIDSIIVYEGEYGEILTGRYPFKDCLGKELHYKKNVGRRTGRNPFTKASYYDAWIYEFKYELLPNCLVK